MALFTACLDSLEILDCELREFSGFASSRVAEVKLGVMEAKRLAAECMTALPPFSARGTEDDRRISAHGRREANWYKSRLALQNASSRCCLIRDIAWDVSSEQSQLGGLF